MKVLSGWIIYKKSLYSQWYQLEISSLVSSESLSVVVASELLKSSDSFGMVNSFNASGRCVLVAF